jgi:hypothetical protein
MMQPGSYGDKHILPRVARPPRARLRELAKFRTAGDQKELQSPNSKDVIEPYDTDDSAYPSAVQADENTRSLPLFYVPRRRAVSPYRPNSERADLRLQELIHHCMSLLCTPRKLKLKKSRYYRRCNFDSNPSWATT